MSTKLNRKALSWALNKQSLAEREVEQKALTAEVLDLFVDEAVTSLDVGDPSGQTFHITRIAPESVSIDLEALRESLTPAQRKRVFTRRVEIVHDFHQEELEALLHEGKIAPKNVPYVSKFPTPYLKLTIKKGK